MPLFFCGVGCVMFVVNSGLCIVLGMKSVIFGVGMRKKVKKWRISAVFCGFFAQYICWDSEMVLFMVCFFAFVLNYVIKK